MEAIILAGGLGTRLAKIVADVPKPMAPIAGKPFLQYIMDDLNTKAVTHVVIAVCHMKECIIDFFGDKYKDISISYSIEERPLFTGGAIKKALEMCMEDYVFVINGDTYFDVNLNSMIANADLNTEIVVAVKKMYNFSRYGEMQMNEGGNVKVVTEKQNCKEGYINGGIYLIKRTALDIFSESFSLENEYFPVAVRNNLMKGFRSDGFFIDIGIPEDYDKAQECFKEMQW